MNICLRPFLLILLIILTGCSDGTFIDDGFIDDLTNNSESSGGSSSSISITSLSGTYNSGTLQIEIDFTQDLTLSTIGGTPSISLDSGGTASCASTSTSKLICQYTIAAGQDSNDLDLQNTTSLSLNGGTLKYTSDLTDVPLTLPIGSSDGSLAKNGNIIIDTTSPTVTGITFASANGTYNTSSTIDIDVTFNDSVIVNTTGGVPRIEFETGVTDRYATYLSGTGTATLRFRYSVVAGDVTGDLDYKATTSFSVNSGTVKDSADNDALLTLPAVGTLAGASAIVVAAATPFTDNIPFTTSGNYTYSTSRISFSAGAASLIKNDSTDDDNSTLGFAGGTHGNTQVSSSSLEANGISLSDSIDSDWPEYTGLVQHLKIDEATLSNGSTISSSIGFDGTLVTNNTTNEKSIAGKISRGVFLDGDNDYITLGDRPGLDFSPDGSDFSILIWVKADPGETGIIFSRRIGTSMNFNVEVRASGSLGCSVGTASILDSDIQINDGNWHQVGLINKGSGSTKEFACVLNGSYQRWKRSPGSSKPTGASILIGARHDTNNSTYTGHLKASFDELTIWDRALSINEVNSAYEKNLTNRKIAKFTSRVMDAATSQTWTNFSYRPSLPANKELLNSKTSEVVDASNYGTDTVSNLMTDNILLVHFPVNAVFTPSAGEIPDTSGEGYNGTPSLGSSSYTNFDSLFGGGIHTPVGFSATKRYTSFGRPAKLDINPSLASFTLSAWVKVKPGQTGTVMSWRAGTDGQYQIWLNSGDVSAVVGGNLYNSGTTINDSRWHHIALVNFDSGGGVYNYALYVDGVQAGVNQTSGATTSANANFLIGGRAQNNDGTGVTNELTGVTIDEVSVWNRNLSSSEITHLYRRGAVDLSFQIRSCDDSACSGESFIGPDGTANTWYSEAYNKTGSTLNATSPSFDISGVVSANRYFQYQVRVQSITGYTPKLHSIKALPENFPKDNPTVINNTGLSYVSLSGFTETVTCPSGTVQYQLSHNGTNFYYFNGSNWVAASSGYAHSNSAATVNTNISQFITDVGVGNLEIKTLLNSDGSSNCSVDNLQISGAR